MEAEDRWYVRFRGHTLGPLTSEQVKSSVRRKELGPDDKLASKANPTWRPLRSETEFLRCWESITRPIPAELTPLPSPKILWQKKRSPMPVAPQAGKAAAPAAPAPEPIPSLSVAETQSKPAAKSLPISAKPKAKAKPTKKAKVTRKPAKLKTRAVAKPAATPAPAPVVDAAPAPSPATLPATSIAAAIPEKPEIQAAPPVTSAEIIPVAAEPAPRAAAIASPKLAEETLSLLEALRDWNRKEKEISAQIQATPKVEPEPAPKAAPILATQSPSPVTFTRPEFSEPESRAPEKKGIELKVNLVISKQFIFISGIILAAALAAVIFTLTEAKKMRGPVDSRLPDPSSPTINPSTENDPIPQLKAPTRPKRD